MREFVKLKELTPEIYMRYKRKRLSDRQIASLYDCTLQTIVDWKRVNDLLNVVSAASWKSWGGQFPRDLKRKKDLFWSLYNQGLKHQHIAEGMDMTRHELTSFKRYAFPELMRKKPRRLTEEEKKIAKENGISLNTVSQRIRQYDMTVEEAITKPLQDPREARKRGKGGRFI
jgi:transposase